jgi:glycine oxidase
VLDRHPYAREASWAAAGMAVPLLEASGPGPYLDLLLAARAHLAGLEEALRGETGLEIGYDGTGAIAAALTSSDAAALATRAAWQELEGLPVRRLTGKELRELEPGASEEALGGLLYPEDHQVDSPRLAAALRAAAVRAGARMLSGASVTGVRSRGGRARGVALEGGGLMDAEAVVLAAGAWSGTLAGLPTALPVRPVHGQAAAVLTPPGRFRHVLKSPRVYLVPRPAGRVIIGATAEDTGFARAVTDRRLATLLAAAAELAPELAAAPVLESWSGLRPGTPDDLPVIGEDPELEGLFYATGHFRNGVLLGPLTGELIGGAVEGEGLPAALKPFSITRFR